MEAFVATAGFWRPPPSQKIATDACSIDLDQLPLPGLLLSCPLFRDYVRQAYKDYAMSNCHFTDSQVTRLCSSVFQDVGFHGLYGCFGHKAMRDWEPSGEPVSIHGCTEIRRGKSYCSVHSPASSICRKRTFQPHGATSDWMLRLMRFAWHCSPSTAEFMWMSALFVTSAWTSGFYLTWTETSPSQPLCSGNSGAETAVTMEST